MYFNRYTPATKSENLETARAFHQYNAICRASGKSKPRFNDYVEYIGIPLQLTIDKLFEEEGWESRYEAHMKKLRMAWDYLKTVINEAGQPLHNQHVVYFAIINGGLKCGEAKNLVQRYSNINRETPIAKMWYMEVESKEQAQAAEHALHNIFDHARCMNRQQNKKDYYECDEASAQRFITANAKDIYEAIMEAIEGI